MTKDQQTSHDFDGALIDIFGQTPSDLNIVELAARISNHAETIRFALKLAKIITSEPSDQMCKMAHSALDEYRLKVLGNVQANPNNMTKHAVRFKAMINQAIREIEG